MSARYFTGIDGKLLLSNQEIAKIKSWSLSAQVETLDTTTTGDAARKFIYGRASWSGSCTAHYYEDGTGALAIAPLLATTFRTAPVTPTQVYTMKFQLKPTRFLQASVLLTEASLQVPAGDIVTVDINFVVTGYPSVASLGQA